MSASSSTKSIISVTSVDPLPSPWSPHAGHGTLPKRLNGTHALPTLANFIKAVIGAGYLALPIAFKHAGIWAGLFLVIFFAFLNTRSMHTIARCAQHLSRQKGHKPLSYGSLAYEACNRSFPAFRRFRKAARAIVNVAIILLVSGICSVNFLYIAVQLKEVVEEYSDYQASLHIYMLIVCGPMVLQNLVQSLRIIAVVSLLGNVFMLTSFVFIFQHLIREEHVSPNSLPAVTNLDGIVAATGAILFAFEAESVVLPLENKLKNPNHIYGILSIGMGIITALYAGIGYLGYIAYGDDVQSVIILNMPHGPLFTGLKVCIMGGMFFGYVILNYIVVEMTWPWVEKFLIVRCCPKAPRLPFQCTLRVLSVLLVLAFAMAVPNLEDIIPLVGVTAGTMLAFVFPSVIEMLTFLPEMHGKLRFLESRWSKAWQIVKIGWCVLRCTGLITIGFLGCFFGLRETVLNIIKENSVA